MKETIAALSQRHKLYIVSNCQDGYVQAFLHAHEMTAYFSDIEMSGRTGLNKGHNIALLMQRNGIESAVYIGDMSSDETAARFAGIPFIHAGYGFGQAVVPDATIASITELPGCLCRI